MWNVTCGFGWNGVCSRVWCEFGLAVRWLGWVRKWVGIWGMVEMGKNGFGKGRTELVLELEWGTLWELLGYEWWGEKNATWRVSGTDMRFWKAGIEFWNVNIPPPKNALVSRLFTTGLLCNYHFTRILRIFFQTGKPWSRRYKQPRNKKRGTCRGYFTDIFLRSRFSRSA